jgi:hypothetical protein
LSGLDALDVFPEKPIDEFGQFNALEIGAGRKVILDFFIQIDRLLENRIRVVKPPARALAEIVFLFHHCTWLL